MDVIIDRFGRVVLPKIVREHLGVGPGSKMHIEEGRREIVLKPEMQDSTMQIKDGVLVFTGSAVSDISQAHKIFRNQRIKNLSGR